MNSQARREKCANALLLEMPMLADATPGEVRNALEDIERDARTGWLTVPKGRTILPRLREVAETHGCSELIPRIEAAIEERARTQTTTARASSRTASARSSAHTKEGHTT